MQPADKKYFLFNKGIHTEAPLVAWPEGFSIDEQNYDLLPDGSRRRRLGLALETGGVEAEDFDGSPDNYTAGMSPFRWTDVGQISGFNFVVMQFGYKLYFWEEPRSGALGAYDHDIDLLLYGVSWTDPVTSESYEVSLSDIRPEMVQFSQINGKLVVVGKHIEPLSVSWDTSTEELSVTILTIEERDLFGIEDGIPFLNQPTTLTDAHQYNLWNRGWPTTDIDDFFTDQAKYPSKNMLHYMGLRRQTDAGYADEDGINVFSPAKIVEEVFGGMSAPQGRIIRDVFNRRDGYAADIGAGTNSIAISAISANDNGNDTWTITITADAADSGVSVADVVILENVKLKFRKFNVRVWNYTTITLDDSYAVVTDPSATQFTITLNLDSDYQFHSVVSKGVYTNYTVGGNVRNTDDSAIPSETRFSTTAAFSGRVFYSGCPDIRIANRVYYSKVVEVDEDMGRCYQQSDPTSEFISDLLPTDGGYIVIPEAGTIKKLLPNNRNLIVFATNGAWVIGPGENGYFSAVGYSLRKLTSAGCVSPRSVIDVEDVPMYWAEDGIYAIIQDSNTGYLSAENITKDRINGLYTSIRYDERTKATGVYDGVRKRALWLYNSRLETAQTAEAPATGEDMVQTTPVTAVGTIDDTDTSNVTFNSALVYDSRLNAFTRWVFGNDEASYAVRDVIAMPSAYVTDNDSRLKFFVQGASVSTYTIAELNDVSYEDFGSEAEAFLMSGPDSIEEPERFKTAPYVHVFLRRQANASTLMQPRWDWARGSDSGKIANFREVYRETRPSSAAYGLIVTKNKVRGRGRNLFLCFKAGEGSDSWIDGWTVKYDITVGI